MQPVTVIGMGLGPQDLTARHQQLIAAADVLVGGKRLLDHFKDAAVEKKPIDRHLDRLLEFVKRRMKTQRVVVLASGDPLFFGIGTRLVDALGAENVVIYPNISTVAAAFARIREPWHDVAVISLHGKKDAGAVLRRLEQAARLAVLTDPHKNPAWIAARLIKSQVTDVRMCVLERLGTDSERIGWYALDRAAGMQFAEPNLVVIKRDPPPAAGRRPLGLGTPDSWFAHPQGLITKAEVRAVTLAKLQLATDHVLWDLGAGSGAVALEASVLVTAGRIFAVEKNPARVEQIRANRARFKVGNLEVVAAVLPAGLEKLPRPDRVFIGGGGQDLGRIIKAAAARLKPDGRMVINTVLIQNVGAALRALKKAGLQTEIIQVQISRGRAMPWGQRMQALNPVWIAAGMRKGED